MSQREVPPALAADLTHVHISLGRKALRAFAQRPSTFSRHPVLYTSFTIYCLSHGHHKAYGKERGLCQIKLPSFHRTRGRSDDTQLVHHNSGAFYPTERPCNRGCQVTDVAFGIPQPPAPPNLLKPPQSLSRPWNGSLFEDETVTLGGNGGHRPNKKCTELGHILLVRASFYLLVKILNQNDSSGQEMRLEYTLSSAVSIRGRHPVLCPFEVLQRPCHTNAAIITLVSPSFWVYGCDAPEPRRNCSSP